MKDILLSKKVLLASILIAVIYIILAVYLMNFSLVKDTIFGDFPLSYKFRLLIALLGGMRTAMTKFSLFLLVLTAVLTGINLTLLALRLSVMRGNGKLHVMVGGSSILAIVSSGCAVCGLPILALLGLSGSIIYLPFHGTEISVVAVMLLLMTLYLMIISYPTEQVCKIINKFYET
ncbi:MAG: hypothetical protein HYZ51_03150 [Candidatus Doudnabacteria bacterium]|nr:hypothetical protein [Candidatus Doudnabacteria bacterium]